LPPSPPLLVPLVPPRERELPPRERVPALRDRLELARGDFEAPPPRDAAPDDFAAPLAARFAVEADLRVADERVEPLPDDAALDELDFFEPADREAPLRDGVERVLDERVPPARFAAELAPADLRAPPDAPRPDAEDVPALAPELSVGLHFPDITRWAASATASAMSEPSLVALATTLLAACEAVSAASSPASRIFLRAAGLALIAAAAAARPAASISLLIAAFASLSTVVSAELERDDDEPEREPLELDREELLRADLAIAYLPPSRERHFKAVPVPE
jgi:hypothetical protein